METKYFYGKCKWSSGSLTTCLVYSALINKDNRDVNFQLHDQKPEEVQANGFLESSVPLFPLNLTKTFPNLTVFSIYDCGLTEILRSDLIGLESLIEIILENNELTSLPNDLLDNMRNLKWISFRKNKIERLDSIMFDGIKNQLEYLDFRGNTFIDDWCGELWGITSSTSMNELMRIIDTKCQKP